MNLIYLADSIANGILLGTVYGLFALGLSLMFGVAGIINFAHGDVFMVAGYLAVGATAVLGSFALGVAASVIVMAVIGAASYFLLFRRLQSASTPAMTVVATLGLGVVLQNGALLVLGGEAQRIQTAATRTTLDVGGMFLNGGRVVAFAVCVVSLLILWLFLTRTRLGIGMRAISQNREAAAVYGIPQARTTATTIAIGFALTAIAAGVLTPLFGVYPMIGLVFIIKAFAIVVVGGFGSLVGTVVVGIAVGLSESLAGAYVSSALQNTAAFILLLLVLALRPHGLVKLAVRES